CENRREIYSLNPNPPVFWPNTFYSHYVDVYVPEASISKYRKDGFWGWFESFHAIVVPHDDGVTDGDDDLK
ncbi:MAG: hypothetical protein MSA83_09210, partial [Bacteroidales bacterium]|nr:hypothetical protein [Bacteroidales bacterium]